MIEIRYVDQYVVFKFLDREKIYAAKVREAGNGHFEIITAVKVENEQAFTDPPERWIGDDAKAYDKGLYLTLRKNFLVHRQAGQLLPIPKSNEKLFTTKRGV